MTDPYGGNYGQYGPGTGGYPQYPYGGPPQGPPPENNLVWAILSTVMCCPPLGIVAIVKASEVNGLWAQGQFEAAHRAADAAKKWSIWSALSLVIFALLYLLFIVFMIFVIGGVTWSQLVP
ncbi:CD225/dispanin family protein [Amycolatopsis suaedae]|uniref:CD225/dispanin family protein n=1 Tax=Amycolatopsis suaedae TaxID=2510978 RepID=A0A4Q7J0N3_9PSEU|nr:CD225/dispanin family protein [Amycolatopsis suaedae]RZQ60357.1 CD225/dispanin family protein [Amycolatopsis suaedae]